MDFSPQKFREIVFQLLFSIDMNEGGEAELVPLLMETLSISKRHVEAALEKAMRIWEARAFLDQKVAATSKEYAFDRIKKVEINVLRLVLFELLIEKGINTKIGVAEGLRLTRKFGTPEGGSFVNALIDALASQNETPDDLTPVSSSTAEGP